MERTACQNSGKTRLMWKSGLKPICREECQMAGKRRQSEYCTVAGKELIGHKIAAFAKLSVRGKKKLTRAGQAAGRLPYSMFRTFHRKRLLFWHCARSLQVFQAKRRCPALPCLSGRMLKMKSCSNRCVKKRMRSISASKQVPKSAHLTITGAVTYSKLPKNILNLFGGAKRRDCISAWSW